MYIDTHAHLDDEQFNGDFEAMLSAVQSANVMRVINAAADIPSSENAAALSEKYSFIYGTAGIHPENAQSFKKSDLAALERLWKNEKIVAIGEIGLDYFYDDVPREVQKKCFEAQVSLAYELGTPVVIHDREAHADCLEILSRFKNLRAVYHCFSGSLEYSREILKLGFYMSFGGAVTFKNARHAPEVLKNAPRERIMLETDSPYMAPVPYRGKRCSPEYIPLIAEKIGDFWGVSAESVGEITTENAFTFYDKMKK